MLVLIQYRNFEHVSSKHNLCLRNLIASHHLSGCSLFTSHLRSSILPFIPIPVPSVIHHLRCLDCVYGSQPHPTGSLYLSMTASRQSFETVTCPKSFNHNF